MGILGKANKEPRSGIFSEWLETLQQESWQLELLISGFALLGVWESQRFINKLDLFNTLHMSSNILEGLLTLLIFVLNIGWIIFLTNLLGHIILRGFWIGAIGLRYVSGEIDYDELGYSEYFTKYLKKKIGKYDDFIERLEKLCSIIFAFTFLLFFLFISILIYFAGITVILSILDKFIEVNDQSLITIFVVFAYLGCGLIMFIDFISLGGLKKLNPGLGEKIFAVIFKFMSLITLSFLYRPLLYNFLDDKYTRRLIVLSIPYFILLIFIFPLTSMQSYPFFPDFTDNNLTKSYTSEHSVQWHLYDDLRKEFIENSNSSFKKKKVIRLASLSSFTISEDYATLFLRQTTGDALRLEQRAPSSALFKKGLRHKIMGTTAKDTVYNKIRKENLQKYKELLKYKSENPDLHSKDRWKEIQDSVLNNNAQNKIMYDRGKITSNLNAFKSLFNVTLDGKDILDECTCKYYKHPNAGENGIICFINIKQLEGGEHELRVAKNIDIPNRSPRDNLVRYIPFLKL